MQKTKTIFRIVKDRENPYVMMDKRPLENPALSYKAKGILAYLLSRPDGWEVNITDLVNHATDGQDAIRSGLAELKKIGHVVYRKCRNEHHQFTKWVIEVHEHPLSVCPNNPLAKEVEKDLEEDLQLAAQNHEPHGEIPHVEKPHRDFPHEENPTQLIKELSNKGLSNKEGEPVGSPPAEPSTSSGRENRRTEATLKGDGVDMLLDTQFLRHPAMIAYREIARLHAPIPLRARIAHEIGDDPAAIEKWKDCVFHWIGHGWNKQNIIGLLQSYASGGRAGCGSCSGTAFPPRSRPVALPAPAQPARNAPTPEEIAAFREKLSKPAPVPE